jgi:hypothetical protein
MANTELHFEMERQMADNWCWAANTASISKYFTPGSNWNQCLIACRSLGFSDCCSRPIPSHCDDEYFLNRSLNITGNLRDFEDNNLNFRTIKAEIDNGNILALRIEWSNGAGHFISIFGYDDSGSEEFLHIGDPLKEKALVSYSKVLFDYEGVGGTWTHSYFTQAPGNNMIAFTNLNRGLLEMAKAVSPKSAIELSRNLKFAFTNEIAKSLPHEIFTIDFKSLLNGETELRKGGIRFMEEKENGDFLIFEYSENSENAQLQQVIHGSGYTRHYDDILQRVIRRYYNSIDNYTLRIIKQPELKVEAFWLHDDLMPQTDKFFPLYSNSNFRMNRKYDSEVFFGKLKTMAIAKSEKRKEYDFDDDKLDKEAKGG